MKQLDSVELARADLAGWLSRLACRLRNDGLALVGRASLESSPGKQDYEDLAEIWNSLERTASLLDAIQSRLCAACQRLDVSERVTFGAVPEARVNSPKKGGKRHEQEEGKGRKAGSRKERHRG
ncbi:MAG: hypothetical protein M1377_00195 [Deltaproteobacteria bacterium]|nr:hypothetical protein [Deltaproteobacteria bacterium]